MIEGDFYDDGRNSLEELLAKGEYKSDTESILDGFKVFQRKYVYKSIALQMTLVVLGLISQIFAVMSAGENEDVSFSWMLIAMCVFIGGYILIRPKNTFRNLAKTLKDFEECRYQAEIYTNKIIISTLYDPYNEKDDNAGSEEDFNNSSKPVENDEKISSEEKGSSDNDSEEDDSPPATVIHLDNSAVEIVDCKDKYVVYIKKVNVFVIPKSAFKPYELSEIKGRLSNIMGVRYKDD